MKLKLEKDWSAAVEINDELYISSLEGILYQSIEDNEVYLYIKTGEDQKKIKIKIKKK